MTTTIHSTGFSLRSVRSLALAGLTAGLLTATVFAKPPTPPANQTLLDQIGTGANLVGDINIYTSMNDPANSINYALVDDFTAGAPVTVTEVDAYMGGWSGFSSFSNVTGYQVNIYSSVAAAETDTIGDIASILVSSASVSVATNFGPANPNNIWGGIDGLVSIPVSISLPTSGTYYLSVVADMSATYGYIGVDMENTSAWGTPNGENSFQVDDNGPGSASYTSDDAAYRVVVPEPATWGVLAGVAALGIALQRRRRKAS